jgi:hypothetical protein
MLIQERSIDEIDLKDETFRISEALDSAAVLNSVREVGQLNPILIVEQNGHNVIVCGFRRIRALIRLGANRVLARTLHGESLDPARAFLLGLWDNLAHRQLDPFEKARVLFKLKNSFGVPDDRLTLVYLPLLGLNPNESVLQSHILLNDVHPALRKCLTEGRLTHASVATIAGMPYPAQNSIASFMEKIRLSASLQRKFLDLLEDISEAKETLPDAPLHSSEVLEIAADPRLSPFQRGERVYEVLYKLRNPRLSQALDRFAAQKKLLRLPGSIQITAHPFFEEPGVRIEFAAPDAEHFRSLAASLEKASHLPEFEELFIVK